MTCSFITTLRQQISRDCRYRAVSVPVCNLPLHRCSLWPFGPHNTGQQYEKITLAVESKWTHRLATVALSSSGSPGLPTIAITAQLIAYRYLVPAVSSLGACLTPA